MPGTVRSHAIARYLHYGIGIVLESSAGIPAVSDSIGKFAPLQHFPPHRRRFVASALHCQSEIPHLPKGLPLLKNETKRFSAAFAAQYPTKQKKYWERLRQNDQGRLAWCLDPVFQSFHKIHRVDVQDYEPVTRSGDAVILPPG